MTGGVLIEHSHRLLGMIIGILCIIQLALGLKIRLEFKRIYLWSIGLLVLVIYQGILGGVTVLFQLPPQVSTLHLGTAELIFVAMIAQVIRIYRVQKSLPKFTEKLPSSRLLWITLVAVYLQILYGASVRHFGYSAGCGLGADYSMLCMDLETGGRVFWPSIGGSQFHMGHRLLGILSALMVIISTIPLIIWAKRTKNQLIRLWAGSAHLIVIAQIVFGIWTLSSHIETLPVSLHLAGATLLLGVVFFLAHYLSALKCAAKKGAQSNHE